MKSLEEIKSLLGQHKVRLIKKYHLKSIGIFGSFSRNEQREDSDIDVLVEFTQPIGLEFVDLAIELEEILGCKVDLVSRNAIKPGYMKYVEHDIRYV